MKYIRTISMLMGILLLWPVAAISEEKVAEEKMMTVEEFEASLHYKQGTVDLLDGAVRLDVPASFRYLNPEDTQRLLEDGWGNPSGSGTLGMLFPVDVSPLSAGGWGIVITYSDDGHISDEDAEEIDYAELLTNMKEETEVANEERKQYGYEPVELVGWAAAPYYDKASHKYHWAKELKFGGNQANTLNYNVRVLGREGVLVLNAVAGMDQLGMINRDIPDVLAFSNFTSGNRYEDFNADTDRMATYGLAALVGGVAAKKLGLLAVIAAFAVKFWKLLLIGGAAVGSIFVRRRKKAAGTE